MAKAFTVTMDVSGFEIGVNYLASNQRITTVQWALPINVKAHVMIWNNGNLVYDRIVTGPASDTENIPGNHQMEWVDIFGGFRWILPSYLACSIYTETTAA